jgi:hypothetical protein
VLVKELVRTIEALHTIPEEETGPIGVLTVPIQRATKRGHRTQEVETPVPCKGKVTQGVGHGGGRREKLCCRGVRSRGLRALIRFRAQKPSFKEKTLMCFEKEALSKIYFWK